MNKKTPFPKQIYLKTGLLFLLSITFILFLQFFNYLYTSYLSASMDKAGWVYYIFASAGHAFLFSLLPFLIIYLPLVLVTRFYKTALAILIVFYLLLGVLAYINGIVFQLYKFHINGFIMDMVFGVNAGQIFVFNSALLVKSAGILALIILIELLLLWISKKISNRISFKPITTTIIILFCCIIVSHLGHAYAAVAGKASIENAALCLPQFYPLTANRLMQKLGVVKKDELPTAPSHSKQKTVVNYPLHPLEVTDSIIPPNIIFLLIDSWNPRSFTPETSPQLCLFSQKSVSYLRHLSSSNGTRGGIFGWFFGLTPSYWKHFEIAQIQPVFIDRLLTLNYDIQTFASATLLNPPFYKVVFGNVKDVHTETPGATPFERDNRITADFLTYIDHHKRDTTSSKPFFAFLFYDLLHAIDLPADYPRKFQPSWEYADYMRLHNDTDPTPFFNLYRNCAWHVDSLTGTIFRKLEEKGLMENTIIIVSGDHSQEFNENRKNFWGHNGNFSDAQLHVPLLYYYPGVVPQTVFHQTTHYDIIPTLMHHWLGVKNEISDYSMGRLLEDSLRPRFHIAGSFDNYAIITDSVIYEKKTAGQLFITDKYLNRYKGASDPQLFEEALLFNNRFLKN